VAPAPKLTKPDEAVVDVDSFTLESTTIQVVDPEMRRVFSQIRRLATDRMPVLLTGESGVGKEIAARALHAFSSRASGQMVPINCGAIPAGLIETELFGHERGAFSGAASRKPGLFEVADGGTVFLDEVADLPIELQVRLLRFLDDRKLRRVGALQLRAVDVRVVAATNRDLELEVRRGRFREDLFYRLSVASIRIPPLRERIADIPALAQTLLDAARRERNRPLVQLSAKAMYSLVRHAWPGNVRELKHLMELVALTCDGREVMLENLLEAGFVPRGRVSLERNAPAPKDAPIPVHMMSLAEQVAAFERKVMIDALEATGWVQRHAARLLRVPRRTFVTKLKRYGIARQR